MNEHRSDRKGLENMTYLLAPLLFILNRVLCPGAAGRRERRATNTAIGGTQGDRSGGGDKGGVLGASHG